MKRRIIVDGDPIEVLEVPYYSQPDQEHSCVVYSVMMVLEYYRNAVRRSELLRIPNLSREELKSLFKVDPNTGAALSEPFIRHLEKKCPTLWMSLKSTDFEEIEFHISHNEPVIVIYDPAVALYGFRAGGHAGVVIGSTPDYLILNNPWLGKDYAIEKISFSKAWEVEFNWGLFIKPKSQTELGVYAGTHLGDSD